MTTGLDGYRRKQLTVARRSVEMRWARYMANQTLENWESWNRMRLRVEELEAGL